MRRPTRPTGHGRSRRPRSFTSRFLSRAPAHATGLNRLGVVYQTGGRHRPSIKLFAKAIAVDDLDAGFRYNIACSYQALAARTPAIMHFRKGITLGMGGKKHVEEFVMENVTIRQCIARSVSQDSAVGNADPFGAGDLAAIANDLFCTVPCSRRPCMALCSNRSDQAERCPASAVGQERF
jgi:hypothetical protein